MSDQETPTTVEDGNALFRFTHKLLLIGVGAAALTRDEIERITARLIERGEMAEQDGRKLFSEVLNRRKEEASKAKEDVSKRASNVKERLTPSSRSDIDNLKEAIELLSKQVDELEKP